jgi:3-oxoacyl-[acyl-carrier-protein] synthase II
MSDKRHRVFVTGAGVISPLGNSTEECWANLVAGKSGAGPITRFDTSAYETRFACEVRNFSPDGVMDRKDAKRMDRFAQFAVAASHEALTSAGLDLAVEDRDRIGVIIGSGIGGMETFEAQHATLLARGPGRVTGVHPARAQGAQLRDGLGVRLGRPRDRRRPAAAARR